MRIRSPLPARHAFALLRSAFCRTSRSLATIGALLLFAGASATPVLAQADSASATASGRVTGRVVDAQNGEGLTDVGVQIVGTTRGTMSGIDGRFNVFGVPAGTVTIQFRRVGYAAKTVTGLMLQAGQTLEQDVVLQGATVQLTTQVVTASSERGSVSEALDRQRTATGVVNSVTSEQIARSPDRDAAQAVQRVSGVTVTDGKYVFVRGLGERYTNTSLNGAALPSPEPERKVVPLDLFPSALLQSVTTSKTFTPDKTGDFTGAQVDIQTREFPARRMLSVSSSVGFNEQAVGQNVLGAPGAGAEWLGFGGSGRTRPNVGAMPGGALDANQSRTFLRELRNVWTPASGAGSPNSTFGASVGGQSPVLGHPLGYVGSLSYAYSQDVRRNELRQTIVGGSSGVRAYNSYLGETGRTSVLWGGIANFSTLLGTRTHLALNNMYNRSADNEVHRDEGFDELQADDPTARTASVRRYWLDYVERSVRSNQLRAEHALGEHHQIDWSLTSSAVSRNQPDRTDFFAVRQSPAEAYAMRADPKAARRLFAELDERVLTPSANYRLTLGSAERQWIVKTGATMRDTERRSDLAPYAIYPNATTEEELRLSPERLFALAADAGRDLFTIQTDGLGYYTANERVGAAYGMVELPIGDRLRVITGARAESWRLRLKSVSLDGLSETSDSVYRKTDVLPSLAVNVRLGGSQTLRASVTRTLSRPEYRELSPLQEKGPIGELDFVGNPALQRALVNNYDLRWEMYPNPGEVLSLGVFAKTFDHPIERVQVSTNGGNIYSFVNADAAENYGVEVDARKNLGALAGPLAPFLVFANATVMRSSITPGNTDISSLTNADRPMVGQAPYVVNGGVTYANESGRATATVLYNVVGRRIVTTGSGGIPDNYLEPRHLLDLSLQLPVYSTLGVKFNARNLLDASYREKQGTAVRMAYDAGRVFSLGLTWSPEF